MVLVAGGSETWSFPSSLSLFAGSIVVSPHPPAALAPSSCSFSSSSIVVNSSSNFTLSLTLALAPHTVTTKPVIYVVNLSQKNFLRKGSKWLPKINQWVQSHGGGQIIPLSCEFEQKVFDLKDDPDGLKSFLEQCKEEALAAGLKGPQAEVKSMIPRLIRAGRAALCLQSFYTAGPKEVRAWTIMKGTMAPQAAGVIHTDFERGFIKAEVCAFDDFKALHQGQASMAKVKEAGKYRQAGKLYVMQEGDIVVFMHNVTTAKKK